jgi:hypothetical protein
MSAPDGPVERQQWLEERYALDAERDDLLAEESEFMNDLHDTLMDIMGGLHD